MTIVSVVLPRPHAYVDDGDQIKGQPGRVALVCLVVRFLIKGGEPVVRGIMTHDALVPVTSSVRVHAALLVPDERVVDFSPFVQLAATDGAPEGADRFELSPFFRVRFPDAFVDGIASDCDDGRLFNVDAAAGCIRVLYDTGQIALMRLDLDTGWMDFYRARRM